MIKIDKEKCEMEGTPNLLCIEIVMFFRFVNNFFDRHESIASTLEELVVCNEIGYLEMQKLMVRLAKAHDRAVKHKKENKLDF